MRESARLLGSSGSRSWTDSAVDSELGDQLGALASRSLPRVVGQMPVYVEDFKSTIQPSLERRCARVGWSRAH
jgi:hypothetical protein